MGRVAVRSYLAIAFIVILGSHVPESLAAGANKGRLPKGKATVQNGAKRSTARATARATAKPRIAKPKQKDNSASSSDHRTRPRVVDLGRRNHPPAKDPGGMRAEIIEPVYATYTIPENQHFRLRMNQSVSSDSSRSGDRFETTVVTPVYVGGAQVVPAGSVIAGKVTQASPARTRGREGEITVAFDTLTLPDGTKHSIEGVITDIHDEGLTRVRNNSVGGRSSNNRKIIWIGAGGAGGAAVGGAIDGSKGAAIGAAIGAGAGIVGAMLSDGHDAVIDSGTELEMETTQQVVISIIAGRW